jgi:tRNA(Ile2) C34 agmatinyltransferase TiaS
MSEGHVNGSKEHTLDEVLMELLAAARSRGPGRYPICPVCGTPMSVVEAGAELPEILRCDSCGARIEDAPADDLTLRLVA